mgnify:CR=1 FL=1
MVGWLLDRFWEGGQVGEVRVYGQAASQNAFWLFPVSCFIAMLIVFLVREAGAKSHVSAPLGGRKSITFLILSDRKPFANFSN